MENKPLTFNKVSVPKSKTKRSNLTYLLDTGEEPSPRIIPEPLEDKKPKKDEVKESEKKDKNSEKDEVKEIGREKIKETKPKMVNKSENPTIIDPETQRILKNTSIFTRRRHWDPNRHQDYLNKQKKNREKEDKKSKSTSKSSKQLCYLECDRLYQMARMKSKKRKHKKKKNTKKHKKKQTKKHS